MAGWGALLHYPAHIKAGPEVAWGVRGKVQEPLVAVMVSTDVALEQRVSELDGCWSMLGPSVLESGMLLSHCFA